MADTTSFSGTPIAVRNPRTGEIDHHITPPTDAELDALTDRLRAAQPAWEALGIEARCDVLRRWADELEKRQDALIAAESADTGRTRIAHGIVENTLQNIRTWADRAPGLVDTEVRAGMSSVWPNVRYRSQLKPYPLVGAITPWNQPLFLSQIDAVPALLAGCAMIVKCSEHAPRFAGPVREAIAAVPELAEVFAYIDGAGETGKALIERVDALCFTGSVPTGRLVAEACARRFIPAFLELGGKDAVIVTETADLDRAARAVVRGSVFATGQVCHAIERVYVQRAAYDGLVERIVRDAESLSLAYPSGADGQVGPFIMQGQAAIVDRHLDEAVAGGARILTGGKSEVLGGGVYMRPTVVVDVAQDMALMQDETFGPVIPVMPYDDEAEAVRLANDSSYGLSGAVIAGSDEEAERIGEQIDAGGISLQDTALTTAIVVDAEKTSFGLSGLGDSRMGPSSILRYFRRKVLMTNTTVPVDMADLVDVAPGSTA